MENKEDWERDKEVKADYKKIEEMVPKIEKGVWEGRAGKNTNKENLGSCHRSQRNV